MGKLLRREDILAASDIQTEEVEVPEWGGCVLVRGMTGAERDEFEASVMERKGKNVRFNLNDARAKLVAACVVDEAGARVFSDSDVRLLTRKSAAALDRVAQAAQRLSGLREDDLEELAKNSPSGQSDDSISD